MRALMVLFSVLGVLAVYGWAGVVLVARPYVPRRIDRRAIQFPSSAGNPRYVAEWRTEAAFEGAVLAIIWPVYLVCRAVIGGLAGSAPLADVEVRARLAERDRRIAELEADLRVWGAGR